ncbi:hypothetical protein [Oligella urethralis]|uniref:hypothetical protein n=1 Tax=Oligella urethralis TaxID=90245 RepID=UPI00242D00C0|nr:hypothetical protein [Oligella urethralis]
MLWRFSSIGENLKRMIIGKKVLSTTPTIYQKFTWVKSCFFTGIEALDLMENTERGGFYTGSGCYL